MVGVVYVPTFHFEKLAARSILKMMVHYCYSEATMMVHYAKIVSGTKSRCHVQLASGSSNSVLQAHNWQAPT